VIEIFNIIYDYFNDALRLAANRGIEAMLAHVDALYFIGVSYRQTAKGRQ